MLAFKAKEERGGEIAAYLGPVFATTGKRKGEKRGRNESKSSRIFRPSKRRRFSGKEVTRKGKEGGEGIAIFPDLRRAR